jgi:hypothetical protein
VRYASGLTKTNFNHAIDSLVAKAAISEPEGISLGGTGNPHKYTEILEPGANMLGHPWETVRMVGGKTKSLRGKVMLYAMMEHFNRIGSAFEIEWKGADLAVLSEGQVSCFEIETNPNTPHIAVNIRRDLKQIGAIRVAVVMETQEQLQRAREVCESRLTTQEMQRVAFLQINNFIKPKKKGKR